MSRFIGCRLRPKRDADLIEAIEEIEQGDLSSLVRRGLRLILNNVKQEKGTKENPPKTIEWNFPKGI